MSAVSVSMFEPYLPATPPQIFDINNLIALIGVEMMGGRVIIFVFWNY